MGFSRTLFVAVACLFLSSCSTYDLTLSLNSLVDQFISKVQENATALGLNPYHFQEIKDTFKLGLLSGGIYLDNGEVRGVDSVVRTGNVTAILEDGIATVHADFAFKDLKYSADFVAEVEHMGPKGKVHGDIIDIFGDLVVIANIENSSDVTVTLQSFNFTKVGTITADVSTNDHLLDAIVNWISNGVTSIFKSQVLHLLQTEVTKVANSTLQNLHFDINSLNNIP